MISYNTIKLYIFINSTNDFLFLISPKEYPNYELCYPYYVPLNGLDGKMANGILPYNGISEDLTKQVREGRPVRTKIIICLIKTNQIEY